MLIAGIIVLCIASILRGWGSLNYRKFVCEGPLELMGLEMGLKGKIILKAIVFVGSMILGLVGAILIGSETSFFVGLIVFVAFWFLTGFCAGVLGGLIGL